MEKVLVFETSNAREYWLKYIVRKLANKNVLFKAYFGVKEIWLNGNRIMFRTLKEMTSPFMAARDNTLFYGNMEYRLENYFKETLKEILLNGKSRD